MMTIKEIYAKFDQIGCLTFATIDDGYPETRIAHLFAYDEDGLYLRTMTVKPFYRQMMETGRLSICGMSSSPHTTINEDNLPDFEPGYMMRATGDVREIPFEKLLKKEHKSSGFALGIKDIRRYPDERAFVMHRFRGEMYDYDYELETRNHKVVRQSFTFGGFPLEFRGMKINENCMGCGKCEEKCESIKFRAISKCGDKYSIDRSRCDVCGSCKLVCPVNAIEAIK